MPKCKICSKHYILINNSHLRKHGIMLEEYREKFPGVSTIDEEEKERKSRAAKQLWADGILGTKEWHENISVSLLAFYQTEEGQRNIERKAQEMGPRIVKWHSSPENNRAYRDMRSKEMKERMSNPDNRARISQTMRDNITPERREQMSCNMRRLWQDPEYRRRMLEVRSTPEYRTVRAKIRANQSQLESTSIERILYGILNEMGVEYEPQVPIDGYTVDALVEGWLILEAYGDYWHNYPDGRDQDSIRSERLQNLNFQVFPFWGHQLRDDPNGCADRITYMVDCT